MEEEVNQFEKLQIIVAKIDWCLLKEGGALQEMAKPIKMGVGFVFCSGITI